MTTIITALHAEAAPIIEKYNLQKAPNHPFPYYTSDTLTLLVSGMEPLNSAIATTWYLSTQTKPEKLVNIGICASGRKEEKIGICYSVRKIIDAPSGKVWHLPQKALHLPQAGITTYAAPQNNMSAKTELADMESSGFYTAATKFLPKEAIALFKIVSDHGTAEIPTSKFVHELISRNLPCIEDLI